MKHFLEFCITNAKKGHEKTALGGAVFSRSLVMKMLHLYRELLYQPLG